MPDDTKEIIHKGLFLTEEDTRAQLEEIIDELGKLIKIDSKNDKVILSMHPYSNSDKLVLNLVGKYYINLADASKSDQFSFRELVNDLSIVKTTLTSPLGTLIYSDYVAQDPQTKNYYVKHYRIKEIVTQLYSKYISKDKGAGLKIKSKPTQNPRKTNEVTTDNSEDIVVAEESANQSEPDINSTG